MFELKYIASPTWLNSLTLFAALAAEPLYHPNLHRGTGWRDVHKRADGRWADCTERGSRYPHKRRPDWDLSIDPYLSFSNVLSKA